MRQDKVVRDAAKSPNTHNDLGTTDNDLSDTVKVAPTSLVFRITNKSAKKVFLPMHSGIEHGFSLARLDGEHAHRLKLPVAGCDGVHAEPSANGYRLSPGAVYAMGWAAEYEPGADCNTLPLGPGRYRISMTITNGYPCETPAEPEADGFFHCNSCSSANVPFFDIHHCLLDKQTRSLSIEFALAGESKKVVDVEIF
jgi:hypothetical protein